MTQSGEPTDAPVPQAPPQPGSSSGYPASSPAPAYPPVYPPYASAALRPGTPGILIAAGVVLLVLAVLAFLWCLLFVLYGALIGSIGSTIDTTSNTFSFSVGDTRALLDAMGPVLIGLGVVALLVALAHGAAGIGVIRRRGWARIAGLVLGGLGLTLNLLGLALALIGLSSAQPLTENGITIDPLPTLLAGIVVLLAFTLAYGFVVVALARRGADFG